MNITKIKNYINKGMISHTPEGKTISFDNAGLWFPRLLTKTEMKKLDKYFKFDHKPWMKLCGQYNYTFYKFSKNE